jgi:N-acetylmuramic acid 6-phosphate etherase
MDHLQTESRNPASAALDELSPLQLVRLMASEDAKVAPAVASQAEAIARAIEVIAERWRGGGRLVYVGAGTSGRLGVLDASECPPTFNVPQTMVVGLIAGGPMALTRAVEGAEDHPEFASNDLAAISFAANDVLVGIATSGRTPYVLGAIDYARRLGAFTIGLACNPDAEIIGAVDLAITPLVGPEILTGSTRLKAGTATKFVLNMLTTGAMVQLGKSFGNLMVDMRATNEKLKARANRIVRSATGLDNADAERLLERCDRDLKVALVSQLACVSSEDARQRLNEANGRVRAAIGSSTPETGGNDSFVLGIDGGGTGTVALLASHDGTILGRGEAGPSNQRAVGVERALANLDRAINEAFLNARVSRCRVGCACLGLAGAGRPNDRAAIEAWGARVGLARSVRVIEDAALLLGTGWGIAVVAGTGSMAYARAADGRTSRAGGWGYLLGDEGSGYAIALAALQAVVRSADGRSPATSLTARFLDSLRLARPQELIAFAAEQDRAAIAALAPIVLDTVDPTAAMIVREAASELAIAVEAAARALDFSEPFPLALAGGLLVASATYREQFLAAVTERGLQPDSVFLVAEPADGAVQIAISLSKEASS